MKHKFSVSLSLALILAMLVTSLAVADNVQNDVVAGGNDTFTLGDSTTVNYRIASNNGDRQTGCNATDGSAASVTIIVPSGVTATPNPVSFTACGTDKPVVFTSTVTGDFEITVNVSDTGDGTYNTNPAKFTLHVLEPETPTDETAPTASPTQDPAANANGWNNTDVTVNWNWTDEAGGSGIDAANCTMSSTSSGEGEITLNATCKDLAGNEGSESYTVKVDKTAPTVSVTPDRDPDHNGWYNASVTFDTAGTDATSGVLDANCTADQTYLSPDGTDLTVSGSCTDEAGNVGFGISSAFDYDDTNPTITWLNVQNFYYGFPPATVPTCEAYDVLSGPDSCSVSGYDPTASVGSHSLTATANDVAGNMATDINSYTVMAWTLNGFYRPVEMDGVWNTVKGGSTVPLKFNVFAGATELTDVGVVKSFTAVKVACEAGGEEDPVDFTTTGGTSLRYDWTDGQFIQNWKIPKATGCYRVTMSTDDGSSLVAFFKLK